MSNRTVQRTATLLSTLLLLSAVLNLTSCSKVMDWLWGSRTERPIDTDDLILGGIAGEDDTDTIYEGAVEYTGKAHSGTDIYYVGKAGSENRNRIIVIDAGHQLKGSAALEPNGPNSEVMKAEVSWGATGVYTGVTEYELNLKVALLLRDELIRRGYSVVMIRETNNVSISNMERAEIANKYNAAAYIRIHANSWTDESMHGAMTICQSANNPYPGCAAHYAKSLLLSQLILDEFCAQTGIHKLNIREMDDLTGTNWSQVPTTLVEMGFLSNMADDRLMATEYFRQEAAIGIANGLDAYFARLAEEESTDTSSETKTETAPVQDTSAPAEPSITRAITETTATGAAKDEPMDTDANNTGSLPATDGTSKDTASETTSPMDAPTEEAPSEDDAFVDNPSGDEPPEDSPASNA